MASWCCWSAASRPSAATPRCRSHRAGRGRGVAGDLSSFLLGRRLGRPFLELHGARVRVGPEQLASVDAFFARHGGKAIVLGRFTGFLRATMPFVAGSSGMALRRLLPFSVLSALVWTALFTCSATRSRSRSPAPRRAWAWPSS